MGGGAARLWRAMVFICDYPMHVPLHPYEHEPFVDTGKEKTELSPGGAVKIS